MKYVKFGIIAALTALICINFAAPLRVKAETLPYAYVKEGVAAYLCSDKDLKTAIFAIPETYCVEIIKEDGDWYYCRYARDEGEYREKRGYCAKADLTPIAEPLENEYLNYTFPVKFYAVQGSSQIPPFEIELTAAFYGNCKIIASPLAYVYCNGQFGYVNETVAEYPRNDVPQPVISPEITDSNPNTATLITAVVITLVAVIAVAVLYFVGKRPKLPPKT